MRITGHRLIELSTASTRDAMSEVARAGQVASSGVRIERPSDDPAAWLSAHRAQARQAIHDGAGKAIATGQARLAQTDGALATIGEAVSRARELAVQGGSDSLGPAERADIAIELDEIFRTALAAANADAVDGEFLFAGHAAVTPFDPSGAFVGDAGNRALAGGDGATHQMTVSGAELTASNGVDVLPAIARLAAALRANDPVTARTLIAELERGGEQVSQARSHTGALLAALDDADQARQERTGHLEETFADAIGADLATAAGDLMRAATTLDAARAVAERVFAIVAPRR